MARLPKPGGDAGDWGRILNEYLEVEHKTDGSLKDVARLQDVADLELNLQSKADASDLASQLASKADRSSLDQIHPGSALSEGEVVVGGAGGMPSVLPAGNPRTVFSWDETGAATQAGTTISPLSFGAKGDGTSDDTAALRAYIETLKNIPAGLSSGNGYVMDGHNRQYVISETLEFSDIWNLRLRNFHFVTAAPMADALLFRGVSFSYIEDVRITAAGGWAGGNTADYGIRWESNQGASSTNAVSTQNTLRNVHVLDIKTKIGIAIGPNSANLQCDQFRLYACSVYGQYNVDTPDATWYQTGFKFGSGTHGNVLLHHNYGCFAAGFKYNLHAHATDVYWYGGIMQNAEADVLHSGQPTLVVEGVRSENSRRFFESSATGGFTPNIKLANITWQCNKLHSDGYWIFHKTGGSLIIENCALNLSGSTVLPVIRMAHPTAGKHLTITGLCSPVPIQNSYTISGPFSGMMTGYTEVTAGVIIASHSGPMLIGETAIGALVGVNAPDTSLYRKTSFGGWYSPKRMYNGQGYDVREAGSAYERSFRSFVLTDTQPRYELLASGRTTFGPGGSTAPDTGWERAGENLLAMQAGDSFKVDGGWNEGHLVMGNYHLWIDATGALRSKSGAPTGDTDGMVVGTPT